MIVKHKLRMDLTQNNCKPVVAAVQGEANTRRIDLSLYNRGAAWEIPKGATAAVAFHKPDGTKGLYTKLPDGTPATTISGNTVEATLAPQALTCAGSVMASIVFYNDAMDTLATFPFQIRVEANPAAGADPSDDYYAMGLEQLNSAYADLLDRVQALEQGTEEDPDGPQIPEWAQQPEKPEYTADEVGAIPEGGDAKASVVFQEAHAEIVRADELTITAGDEGKKNITLWYGGQTSDGSGQVVDIVDEDHNRPGVILRGLAAPELDDDAANKGYVDTAIQKALGGIENGAY